MYCSSRFFSTSPSSSLSPSRLALMRRLPSYSVRCCTVYSSTLSVMKMISMSLESSFSTCRGEGEGLRVRVRVRVRVKGEW